MDEFNALLVRSPARRRPRDDLRGPPIDPAAPRIFRFVVRLDRGTTPNPWEGWCSMAVCKPQIRRTARVGDWVLGLRSRRNDEVVAALRVDEVMTLTEYWRDPRFRAKRPGRTALPDNLYRPDRRGEPAQVPNPLHDASDIARDVAGRRVLVSWRYWYFGDTSPPLPTDLIHLVHSNQGHALHLRRKPDDVEKLVGWLAAWPTGIHGRPIDAPKT